MNVQQFSTSALPGCLMATALAVCFAGAAGAEERHVAAGREPNDPPARVMERSSPSPSYEPPSSSSSSSSDSSSSSYSGHSDGQASRTRPSRSHDGGGPIRVDGERGRGGRHDGHGGHYGGRGHGYGGYGGWNWGWGPYSYWPWWWGGGYYEPPYGYYGGGPRYYERYNGYDEDAMGALDLDISPERAQIFVDGQYLGVADDFDGFPTYLWLPKGTYDVVIYLDGYQTIARQYSIYPGVVVDVEDGMVPGEAQRPEDLMPKTHPRRDQRMEEEREQEEQADRAEAEERRPTSGAAEAARVVLRISPSDASIYLDGRFIGTAADLGRLHSGLIVDAGPHRLEIVRPGYESERSELTAEPGEEVTISLDLEKSRD